MDNMNNMVTAQRMNTRSSDALQVVGSDPLTCQKLRRSPRDRGAQHRLTARPEDRRLGARAREERIRGALWFGSWRYEQPTEDVVKERRD